MGNNHNAKEENWCTVLLEFNIKQKEYHSGIVFFSLATFLPAPAGMPIAWRNRPKLLAWTSEHYIKSDTYTARDLQTVHASISVYYYLQLAGPYNIGHNVLI